jgi:hypothetical protein
MFDDNLTLAAMAEELAKSADYRVLRRLLVIRPAILALTHF